MGLSDQDPCGTNGWPAEFVKTAPSANKVTLPDLTQLCGAGATPGYEPRRSGLQRALGHWAQCNARDQPSGPFGADSAGGG